MDKVLEYLIALKVKQAEICPTPTVDLFPGAVATPPTATASAMSDDLPSQTSSPPRKRRTLFASYAKHVENETSNTVVDARPSAAAAVMTYVDALPSLVVQANQSKNPWSFFRSDPRFTPMHLLLEKLLCVPATSAPVERIFSHGGLFMRPHRARLGQKLLAELVFVKCNKDK